MKGSLVKSNYVDDVYGKSYGLHSEQNGVQKEKRESRTKNSFLGETKKRNSYLEQYQQRQSILK